MHTLYRHQTDHCWGDTRILLLLPDGVGSSNNQHLYIMHPLHYHLDWVQFILSPDHDVHHIVQEDDDGARSTIGVREVFLCESSEKILL